MSLIKADELGNDFEDKVAPEGVYDLRISSAKVKDAKSGRKMIAVGMQVTDDESIATIFHNINVPNKDTDEPRAFKLMMRDWLRFMKVFGVPNDGADIDEDNASETLNGLTAKLRVVQEEAQDGNGNKTGEMRNVIRLPKV